MLREIIVKAFAKQSHRLVYIRVLHGYPSVDALRWCAAQSAKQFRKSGYAVRVCYS